MFDKLLSWRPYPSSPREIAGSMQEHELHKMGFDSISQRKTRILIQQALCKGAATEKLHQVLQQLKSRKTLLRKAFSNLAKHLPRSLIPSANYLKSFSSEFEQEQWESHLQRIREEQLVLLEENRLLLHQLHECWREGHSHYNVNPSSTEKILHIQCDRFSRLLLCIIQRAKIFSFHVWKNNTIYMSRWHEKSLFSCILVLNVYLRCREMYNKHMAFNRLSLYLFYIVARRNSTYHPYYCSRRWKEPYMLAKDNFHIKTSPKRFSYRAESLNDDEEESAVNDPYYSPTQTRFSTTSNNYWPLTSDSTLPKLNYKFPEKSTGYPAYYPEPYDSCLKDEGYHGVRDSTHALLHLFLKLHEEKMQASSMPHFRKSYSRDNST